jgi:uncharacterized protein (DUF1919 family)
MKIDEDRRLVRFARKIKSTRFSDPEFSVVSNNCWGAHIYQQAKLPYRTPFVNLFLYPSDYLKMLENFYDAMATPLHFLKGEDTKYPIGRLDDISVHFLHYADEETAVASWRRRLARLTKDPDRTFIKFCNRDGATKEHAIRFQRLPFKNKVYFTNDAETDMDCAVKIPYDGDQAPDGLQLSAVSPRYFDAWRWIERGSGAPSIKNVLRTV